MNDSLAFLGLVLSLAGTPLLLLGLRGMGVNTLRSPARFSLWVIAGIALFILMREEQWRAYAGLAETTWKTLAFAGVGVVLSFAGASVIRQVQMKKDQAGIEDSESFHKLAELGMPERLFLVLTAGVTEEILYRAYGIGYGSYLLGSTWLATLLSIAAFTLAHLRWGRGHLAPVIWAAVVMSGLFLVTRDIVACIAAHLLVDAVGVLLGPAIVARARIRTTVERGS